MKKLIKSTRLLFIIFCMSIVISCTKDNNTELLEKENSVEETSERSAKPQIKQKGREQMRILKKESQQLIDEMAIIIGRNLDKKLLPVGKFDITFGKDGETTSATITHGDEITIGYYCDPPGICSSEPCGSSSNGKSLSENDYQLMQRLQRNLSVKIDEIAKITGKNISRTLTPVGKFQLSIEKDGAGASAVITHGDEITIGYECDPPGISSMEPCGS